MKSLSVIVVLLFGALLSGCASTPHVESLEPRARTRAVLFDGHTGNRVAWDDMVEAAQAADAVFIGEMHGHPLGLAASSARWDDILDGTESAALALEFFERDQQSLIDDYLRDVVTEEQFKTLARRKAGNYPLGHSTMIEAAKAADRPVFAANSPRRYLKVGREGYEAYDVFTDEQRRLFAVPDEMPGGSYREDFMELMGGMSGSHGDDEAPELTDEEIKARLEASFRSQSIWDATMSDTVARAVADCLDAFAQHSFDLLTVRRSIDFDSLVMPTHLVGRQQARSHPAALVDLHQRCPVWPGFPRAAALRAARPMSHHGRRAKGATILSTAESPIIDARTGQLRLVGGARNDGDGKQPADVGAELIGTDIFLIFAAAPDQSGQRLFIA